MVFPSPISPAFICFYTIQFPFSVVRQICTVVQPRSPKSRIEVLSSRTAQCGCGGGEVDSTTLIRRSDEPGHRARPPSPATEPGHRARPPSAALRRATLAQRQRSVRHPPRAPSSAGPRPQPASCARHPQAAASACQAVRASCRSQPASQPFDTPRQSFDQLIQPARG